MSEKSLASPPGENTQRQISETIKSVIFDIHDTLVYMSPRDYEVIAEALDIPVDICKRNWDKVNQRLADARGAYKWPPNNSNDWIKSVYEIYLDELGVERFPNCLIDEIRNLFSLPRNCHSFSEVRIVLERLNREDIRIGVLSNTDVALFPIFGTLRIAKFIKEAISVRQFNIEKPGEQAFLLILKKLDARAADCIYVGDNFLEDAQGAARVGMQAVLISRDYEIYDVSLDRVHIINDSCEFFSVVGIIDT